MLVYGRNVVNEILNNKTKIYKVFLDNNYKDEEILNKIEKSLVVPFKGGLLNILLHRFYRLTECIQEYVCLTVFCKRQQS